MDSILVILGAILTVAASGLLAGIVTFALNERRADINARLQKAEEACLAMSRWCDELGLAYIASFDLGLKEISSREISDRCVARQEISWKYHAQTRTIVLIYFPDSESVIEAIAALARDMAVLNNRMIQARDANGLVQGSDFERMQELLGELNTAQHTGVEQLIQAARRVKRMPLLHFVESRLTSGAFSMPRRGVHRSD